MLCFIALKKNDGANDITDEILFMGVVREAMTITTICNWYKRFRTGNFYSKDEGRSCHPAATNMDATNISKTT